MALDNRAYWLWLQQGLGAGSHKLLPFLKRFGSPRLCFEAGGKAGGGGGEVFSKEQGKVVFFLPFLWGGRIVFVQGVG